jgi:multidrug efflux pump subunit AcrA (membrane-fusion protein)
MKNKTLRHNPIALGSGEAGGGQPRLRSRLWVAPALAIFLALGMLLTGCSALSGGATPTATPLPDKNTSPLVNATGKVMPAQYSRLGVTVPGAVDEIPVKEGQQVKKGDVLVRLKGKADLQAAIAAAEAERSAAQKGLEDLYDNANKTSTAALEAISLATKELRDAQYALDNFTMPQTLDGLSVNEALSVTQKKLDIARTAFDPYKYYPSGDKTRKDLKKDLDNAQADYNSAVKQLQYVTDYAAAQAHLAQAQKDYETWKDGPDPKAVAVAQARLDNANSSLAATQAQLKDLELLAPFDGTVSEVDVRLGEWVNPGQPVLLLADLANLQIETTDLNEIDAARIAVGSPVSVTFDALPGIEVNGKVTSIAPKASEGSGVNYKAVILLDELPAALRWGMTAFADIAVKAAAP